MTEEKNREGYKKILDTELLTAWKLEDKKKEKEERENFKDAYKIKYKDLEIALTGFTICTDKKTNKFMFAYKFKHDAKTFLYYFPEENKDSAEIKEVSEKIFSLVNIMGYNLQDATQTLESIYLQKDIIDKSE